MLLTLLLAKSLIRQFIALLRKNLEIDKLRRSRRSTWFVDAIFVILCNNYFNSVSKTCLNGFYLSALCLICIVV